MVYDGRIDFFGGLVAGALVMALALQHRRVGRAMKSIRSVFTWKEELVLPPSWKPGKSSTR